MLSIDNFLKLRSRGLLTSQVHVVFVNRDANTGFLANRFSVVENRFQSDFWFYWPSQKFIFQAQLNLVIYGFFAGHI